MRTTPLWVIHPTPRCSLALAGMFSVGEYAMMAMGMGCAHFARWIPDPVAECCREPAGGFLHSLRRVQSESVLTEQALHRALLQPPTSIGPPTLVHQHWPTSIGPPRIVSGLTASFALTFAMSTSPWLCCDARPPLLCNRHHPAIAAATPLPRGSRAGPATAVAAARPGAATIAKGC